MGFGPIGGLFGEVVGEVVDGFLGASRGVVSVSRRARRRLTPLQGLGFRV